MLQRWCGSSLHPPRLAHSPRGLTRALGVQRPSSTHTRSKGGAAASQAHSCIRGAHGAVSKVLPSIATGCMLPARKCVCVGGSGAWGWGAQRNKCTAWPQELPRARQIQRNRAASQRKAAPSTCSDAPSLWAPGGPGQPWVMAGGWVICWRRIGCWRMSDGLRMSDGW